ADVHPRIPSILETMMQAGSSEAKQALARAIARRPDPRFNGLLTKLAVQGDPAVGREVARAMRVAPSAGYLESLRSLLARRDSREEARRTLAVIGQEAQDFLASSLSDESLPPAVRRHVPRTLVRFDPPAVGPVLLKRLAVEPDGAVRFKILRALGNLRTRNPGLALDARLLDDAIEQTLETVFRLLDWRVSLGSSEAAAAGAAGRTTGASEGAVPGPRVHVTTDGTETPVRTLIEELLQHKEEHAMERLFRLFSLRYPREDFKRIHRGLGSRDRKTRASGRELLESVLKPPLRDAVVGVLDDVPDEQRLAAGRRYHRRGPADRRALLRTLLEQGSVPLRCLVAYHVAETGMKDLREELAGLCDAAVGAMEETFRNALHMLDDPGKEKAFVVPVR
ncbi:MAG TPA: HEAT repeat domain-containing protein, partial [bacterium]|nr:HEAT repeat domain-containing protein [bacterium]